MEGTVSTHGTLAVRKIERRGPSLAWKLANYLRPRFIRGWLGVKVFVPIARAFGIVTAYGTLKAVLQKADGERVNYTLLDYHLVTTAFVDFVTDQLQTETSVFGDFKYHDSGVGVTNPAITDVDIETTDGESRATGTQTESAHNVYVSVGTISYTTDKAITEHGLFNAASSGTLMDRSEFAAINVTNGDSVQFTYSFTIAAGG